MISQSSCCEEKSIRLTRSSGRADTICNPLHSRLLSLHLTRNTRVSLRCPDLLPTSLFPYVRPSVSCHCLAVDSSGRLLSWGRNEVSEVMRG